MSTVRWISPSLLEDFRASGTDACRLASGDDGFVERLGRDALVAFRSERARGELLDGLDAFPWKPERVFGRRLPRRGTDRAEPELLRGDEAPDRHVVVVENGVRYGVDLGAGASHGLFLDQRDNRARLREFAPQRVLNLFAYTCSFSVVAALAGAQTVSVDLSKRFLGLGRGNFELNGLDPSAGHRFLADDAVDVVRRLARRGERFDAVVLDPPTFSRSGRGRRWQVESDLPGLLAGVLDVTHEGGRVLLSTNCTSLDARALEAIAKGVLESKGRVGSFRAGPVQPDFPPGHGAATSWLRLGADRDGSGSGGSSPRR